MPKKKMKKIKVKVKKAGTRKATKKAGKKKKAKKATKKKKAKPEAGAIIEVAPAVSPVAEPEIGPVAAIGGNQTVEEVSPETTGTESASVHTDPTCA